MPENATRLNAALADRYRIERELGQGGMAVVYLAQDVRHDRKVAIKVLNAELAAVIGADRFLGEIRTTANLQHPHILPLFDSGEADGFLYYVMPYVEGESLRDRLDREKQLPIGEAVAIATKVAGALRAAHEQGVIHRDIKPANILLSKGEPLVADFGIALAVSAAGGGRLTETGLSLGTPYYMSPEQATADRDPDARSDIYSLACVLYEMLVGEPPHTGTTAQAVLARILTERPRAVTEIRATVPGNVAAAIARSLERLPADRFDSADDFAHALSDPAFTHAVTAAAPASATAAFPAASAGPGAFRWLPWGVAAVALVAAALSWITADTPSLQSQPAVRLFLSNFVIDANNGGWRLTISRDGSTIVAAGVDGLLYARRSDDPQFRPIPGTDDATYPSISPDAEWVAFTQDRALRKVQIVGGPVLPVAPEGRNPHWYAQDEIVFNIGEDIFTTSAAGGTATLLAKGGPRPFMLPGRRGIIADGDDGLYVHDLESGEATLIAAGGSNGRYLPTGHILYGDRHLQAALAAPFDLRTLTVTGSAVPVLPSINVFGGGATQLAVSDNGTLVHAQSSGGGGRNFHLSWITMEGIRTDLTLQVVAPSVPRISPDGTRLAYFDRGQIIAYRIETGEQTDVAEGAEVFEVPVWSPNGQEIFYSTHEEGWTWHRVAADASSAPQEIATGMPGPLIAVSRDGNLLIGEAHDGETQPDIFYARAGTEPLDVRPYLRAAWHEEEATLSPDGAWLAYTANETGAHGVYLRAFPEPGPAVRLSVDNGGYPAWTPEGDAIIYAGETNIIRRPVTLGSTIELGDEQTIFSRLGIVIASPARNFDIHPDGDRILVVTRGDPIQEQPTVPGIGQVVVVVNWFEELRQRMGN